jgi:curved DNA-binding protein CbpA
MSHHKEPRRKRQRTIDTQSDQALIDPYQVLGITRQANEAAIKKAYFTKVREHPPERDPEQFKRIRGAYDALRTPEAKAATDLFLLHTPLPYQPYKRPPAYDLAFHAEDWLVLARAQSDLVRTDFSDDFREINL